MIFEEYGKEVGVENVNVVSQLLRGGLRQPMKTSV